MRKFDNYSENNEVCNEIAQFISNKRKSGDSVQITADEESTSYTVKYVNGSGNVLSWIHNDVEGYTSENVMRDIRHIAGRAKRLAAHFILAEKGARVV